MNPELERRVEALRRPLELAAADGFQGVRKVKGLGHALRAAVDALIPLRASELDGLDAWRATLTGWEQLDEMQQAMEVARGMRLIARLPRRAQPQAPTGKPVLAPLPTRVPATPVPQPGDVASTPRTAATSSGGATQVVPRTPAVAMTAPAKAAPKPAGASPSTSSGAAPIAQPAVASPPASSGAAPAATAKGSPAIAAVHERLVAAPTANPTPQPAPKPAAKPVWDGDPMAAPTHTLPGIGPTLAARLAERGLDTVEQLLWTLPRRYDDVRGAGSLADACRLDEGVRATFVAQVVTSRMIYARGRRWAEVRLEGVEPRGDGGRVEVGGGGGAGDIARGAGRDARGDGGRVEVGGGGGAGDIARGAGRDARGDGGRVEVGGGGGAGDIARGAGRDARGDGGRVEVGSGGGAGDIARGAGRDARGDGGRVEVGGGGGAGDIARGAGRDARGDGGRVEVGGGGGAGDIARGAGRDARGDGGRVEVGGGGGAGDIARGAGRAPDRASAVVRWFNVYSGIEKRMPPGARVVLSGLMRKRGGRTELANPDILGIQIASPNSAGARSDAERRGESTDDASDKPLASILPRYSEIAGVPAGRVRQACAAACERVGDRAEDGVPATVEAAVGLPSLPETLARLHAPSPEISVEELAAMNNGQSQWQRRLAFGELFALGVAVALRRRERRSDRAVPCPPAAGLPAEVAAALPFTPTTAQLRSIAELGVDLGASVPMNRLLQGDVGSGKTAVAFAAAIQVARAGRQTAVMAPTELLAEQHFETWKEFAARGSTRLRVELLTASTPKGVRASLLALLAAGKVDVLIGTHSLLSEAVGFAALGLVIIDEQHRFGVAQRAKLRDKGDGQGAPHLLVMTATPIPRTLALTAYGDLDVSTLDELPPGRTPIATKILTGARGATAAYKLIGERVAAGERVYVVCPKIDPTEEDELEEGAKKRTFRDATTTASDLAKTLTARVGLVHGRLDSSERDRVMRAFKLGELDVLVATTVIEVGVDVPAATTMIIHDAERFGLAQLHQLRGRVGRGSVASRCVLLAQSLAAGSDAEARLAAMVATTDGFRIAEQDLLLRGHGELLGPRQAGAPRLRFGDLAQHTALLLEARGHAEAILDEDPDLVRPQHAALRRALERRLAHDVYGAEGG